MSGSESDHDSSLSMDESSNSTTESSKKPSSSNDTESSSNNDSSRSETSSPETTEHDSPAGSPKMSAEFMPLKPQQPSLTFEELKSSDYEIWTVSVPGNLNANKLHDLELSLSKSTKFTIGQSKYETILRPEKEEMSILIPNKQGDFHLTTKGVAGHLAIVEDVGLPDPDENHLLQTKKMPEMPQNLKRRHPIYGHGFEAPTNAKAKKVKKIKKEPEETATPVKEKKKKKKKSEQC